MEFISPTINRQSTTPVYSQIYSWIRQQIILDHLQGGEKLPSLRKLSFDLNVSKNTVLTAYEQLVAEGYVESIAKIGYQVLPLHSLKYQEKEPPKPLNKPDPPQDYLYNLTGKGLDPHVFQKELWKKVTNIILKEEFHQLTSYGDPQGEMVLRQEIVKYVYESRGIVCSPHEIVIGAGTQCCLNLLCQMLLSSKPSIAYESPGTKWLRFLFEGFGYQVDDLPILSSGYDIEQLYALKSKIIFVTPSHQFMKGKTISARNRVELLNWACETDGLIIEDDYDSEVRYLADTIPPLKSMDQNSKVVYISSLSKIFMPSMRIAFMILPEFLLDIYHERFFLYEQTSSTMHQKTLARFMKEGYFDSHIRRLKKQYRLKSDVIFQALHQYLEGKVEVIFTKGGVTMLLAVNSQKTEEELVALANAAGIQMKTVTQVYARHMEYHQIGRPKVYLTFKMLPMEDIPKVVKLLSQIWF